MLFLLIVPIGLLLGWIMGGQVSRLGNLSFRRMGLVGGALLLQLLIFPVFSARAILPFATALLHILSYALLVTWILVNRRTRPIVLLGLGAGCNFAVVLANRGFMPASLHALRQSGLASLAEYLQNGESYSNLIPMSRTTQLNFLADVLYVPKWIPFSSAFSIGDLLIAVALIWLIVGDRCGLGASSLKRTQMRLRI